MKVSLLKEMYCCHIAEPIQAQSGAVVGDDGELLQPDMTVYPDYYTDYKAPYIHRNGLLLGIYDNLRENGFTYLLLSPITPIASLSAFVVALTPIVLLVDRAHSNFMATIIFLGVGCIASFLGYLAMRQRNYFR